MVLYEDDSPGCSSHYLQLLEIGAILKAVAGCDLLDNQKKVDQPLCINKEYLIGNKVLVQYCRMVCFSAVKF